MLDSIKSFFQTNIEPAQQAKTGEAGPNIELAACALLLELAHADEEFADSERRHIESAIQRHFELDAGKTKELIELADRERRQSSDLFQFTSLISNSFDEGQKMVLIEAMWGLVYADGEVAEHETYLMRKISNLLGVKPGYLAELKKRVAKNQPSS